VMAATFRILFCMAHPPLLDPDGMPPDVKGQ